MAKTRRAAAQRLQQIVHGVRPAFLPICRQRIKPRRLRIPDRKFQAIARDNFPAPALGEPEKRSFLRTETGPKPVRQCIMPTLTSIAPDPSPGRASPGAAAPASNLFQRINPFRATSSHGHGKEHLSTVFLFLTMLAVPVDQMELFACSRFKRAQYERIAPGSLGRNQMPSSHALLHEVVPSLPVTRFPFVLPVRGKSVVPGSRFPIFLSDATLLISRFG